MPNFATIPSLMTSSKTRVEALRKRRAAAGLVRLEVYAPKALHEAIKAFVKKLIAENYE